MTRPGTSALLALLTLLGLQCLPLAFLPHLNINNAPDVYLPATSPTLVFEKALREQFPTDQVLVVMFAGDDLFSPTFIGALDEVVKRIARQPLVDRVLAVTSLDRISGSEDGFVVEPLLDAARVSALSDAERRTRVLEDRFAPGLLVAEDGSAMAMVVRPRELQDSRQRQALEHLVVEAIREAGMAEAVVAVAGHVALEAVQLRSMIRDTATFVPLTTGLGLFLIWWLFRRLMPVVFGGLAIGAAANVAVGVLVLAGKPYTLVSAMIPPLMAALTVALLIHFYNALQYVNRRGLRGEASVRAALREVRRPAFFTAITTAGGLASLGLSPIDPIRTFGLVAAVGVIAMFVTVIGLLPPIFARWDRGSWSGDTAGVRAINHTVRAMADVGIRRAGWVLAITALALAVGIPQIWNVSAETDFYQNFEQQHPINESTRRIEEGLAGVMTLEVVFEGSGRDSLKDPQRLKAIKAFQDWADGLPDVDRTVSMVDIVEEMHWAFHGEDPKHRKLPDSRALISQYLFIYDGQDLYDLVNREFSRTRVALNLKIHGANAIEQVIIHIENHLEGQDLHDLQWRVAGFGKMFADQEDLLITGQLRSLWGALALMFVLMLVLWRSLGAAVLCMIPNVSPILLIFIVMGALGIRLDMATAMIASVAVGIAVDDTIHIYYGYRRRTMSAVPVVHALMRTFRQAGRAVTATTLVLSGQFMILIGSQFQPTVYFGLLTAVGLLAALAFDLLLLPAMLVAQQRLRRR